MTTAYDPAKLAKAKALTKDLLTRRREVQELCRLLDWSYAERVEPYREAIRTVRARSGANVLKTVSVIKSTMAKAGKELNEVQGSLLLCAALEELEADDYDGDGAG
jgi:hypothetical protein